MAIKKPTLTQWAYIYFHQRIWKAGFFVPGLAEVDVTPIVKAWEAVGEKPPWTAILLHALGTAGELHPAINRAVVSPFGALRIIQFDDVSVALPVAFEHEGKMNSRLEVIRNPHKRTISEIRQQLRDLKKKPLNPKGPTALLSRGKNVFWNRWLIKIGIWVMEQRPSFFEKNGASLGLSSLATFSEPGYVTRLMALGPSALSLTFTGTRTDEHGKSWIEVGFCFNHLVCRGDEVFIAGRTLWGLLAGKGKDGLTPYLPDPTEVRPALTEAEEPIVLKAPEIA